MHILDIKMIANIATFFDNKKDAIEYGQAIAANLPQLIAQDINEHGAKRWGIVKLNELMQLNNASPMNEHLYSSFDDVFGQIPKFVLDIDIAKDEVTEEQWTALLSVNWTVIVNFIDAWIKSKLAILWPNNDLGQPHVFQSLNVKREIENKISFHIIYNVRFPAFYDIRRFIENAVHEQMNEKPQWWPFTSFAFMSVNGKMKNIIDYSIYGHGVFRLPYQSKKGKVATLQQRTMFYVGVKSMLLGWSQWPNPASEGCLSSELFEYNDDIKQQLTTMARNYKPIVEAKIDEDKKADEQADNIFFYCLSVIPHNVGRYVQFNILSAYKNYIKDHPENVDIDKVLSHFITAGYIKQHGLIACKEYMQKTYDDANGKAGIGFMIHIARRYCKDIKFDKFNQRIDNLINDWIGNLDNHNPIDLDGQYVADIDQYAANDIIIDAPMGMGKSTTIKRYIKSLPMNTKILMLTNRRVLSRSLLSDYDGCNFIHYDDLYEERENNNNRYIVQLESIAKIDNVDSFDLIILDEVESLITQMFAPTHRNKMADNAELLFFMIRNARQIIAMDAYISERTFTLLSGRPAAPIYIRYKNNPRPRNVKIYEAAATCINTKILKSMKDDIMENRKLYVFSNSLRQLKRIHKMMIDMEIPDANILQITSEISNKKKNQIFANVNEHFGAARHVLASPSLTVGVSVTEPFHAVYLFINGRSCPVRDCLQSSMRCRNLVSNMIHIQIDKTYEVSTVEFDQPEMNGFHNEIHAKLYRSVVTENLLSQQHPNKMLCKLLEKSGYIQEDVRADEVDQDDPFIKEIKSVKLTNIDPVPWKNANYQYLPDNRINFESINVRDCLIAMARANETDAEKDIIMRWQFQENAHKYGLFAVEHNEIDLKLRIDLIDRIFGIYCSDSRQREHFNTPIQNVIGQPLALTKGPIVSAKDCAIIRSTILEIFFKNNLNVVKQIEVLEENALYTQLRTYVVRIGEQLGFRISHKKDSLSLTQFLGFFDKVATHCNLLLNITKKVYQRRTGVDNERVKLYELELNDCALRCDYRFNDKNPYEMDIYMQLNKDSYILTQKEDMYFDEIQNKNNQEGEHEEKKDEQEEKKEEILELTHEQILDNQQKREFWKVRVEEVKNNNIQQKQRLDQYYESIQNQSERRTIIQDVTISQDSRSMRKMQEYFN